MKRQIPALCFLLLLSPVVCPIWADDLSFDSFEAAEASAKKRADEYQKKMQEHIKSINDDWEKQQKDLGSDSSSPDISKITARQDGQKSSDSDAGNSLENAVNSSVNKLKNDMINTAGPNSTGFAGGGAGYQWSVKFKNGKYVLSDSYNEAEFNTGKKKESPKATPPESENKDTDEATNPDDANQNDSTPKNPNADIAPKATPEPAQTADSEPAVEPSAKPDEQKPVVSDNTPAKAVPATTTEEPSKPLVGLNPAPTKLPPPAVRLVIQHPTDFSEETFASNATSETPTSYKLNNFKIPEDTRIKIAVELGQDINPEDVSLVVTDEEGDGAPVTSTRLRNYRHMFRVPSEDKYSASVYVTDSKTPGKQSKKILQVMIPVTKMDFESRTIDNQHGTKSGSSEAKGAGNTATSDTSSSASNANVKHSSLGQPQQTDLSDLYAEPGSSANTGADNSADSNGNTGTSGTINGDENSSKNESGNASNEDNAALNSSSDSSEAAGTNSDGNSSRNPSTGRSKSSGNSTGSEDGLTDSASTNDSDSANTPTSSDDSSHNSSSPDDVSDSGSGSDSTAGSDSAAASDSNLSSGSDSESESGSISNSGSDSGKASNPNTEQVNTTTDASGDEQTANSANNPDNQQANAGNSDGSTKQGSSQTAPVNAKNASNGDQAQEEEDAFLMALSLRAESQKIYQSFDFIDGSSQTSSAVKAGGEVIFGLSMSSKVDPLSIAIKLSDGSQEVNGNLKRMGESFAYVFAKPTKDAFIELTGKAGKNSFTYRVVIPVTAN